MPGSCGRKCSYVEFGNWSQSVKEDNVTIDTSKTVMINNLSCYKASDNCYYVKAKAGTYNPDYYIGLKKFDNGKPIDDDTEYYFKVEPIKWRVRTYNNNYQGGKLLVAENILVASSFSSSSNDYANSNVRAWLNNDFINKAFSKEDIESINTVTVDNENIQDKLFY